MENSESTSVDACPLEPLDLETPENDGEGQTFRLINQNFLEIDLNRSIWVKDKSIVASSGQIRFGRADITDFLEAEGQGVLCVSGNGHCILVLSLDVAEVIIKSNHILAYEQGIKRNLPIRERIGQFDPCFERVAGPGMLAITVQRDILAYQVLPERPVFVDPTAVIAWSASLSPMAASNDCIDFVAKQTASTSLQIMFAGMGWVMLQPCREEFAA